MSPVQEQNFEFDRFRVDVANRSLSHTSDGEILVTPKVFDTLLYLIRNRGRVVGKDELLREVWPDTVVEENNLSQNISALRRIFGEKPGERRFIETVAGRGFRFVPDIRLGPSESPGLDSTSEPKTVARSVPGWALAGGLVVLLLGAVAAVYYTQHRSAYEAGPIAAIAVLPFKPIVAENRNPALEIGMADTLIWKLSGGDVRVRPLSSVRQFDALDQDPAVAGRALSVDAVIDGSINVVNDRIRISAQLLRVSDGRQLWAGQFDERSDDIFYVQDSIAAKVASELKVRLGTNDRKRYTKDAEAYQLFLKGRYLSQRAQPAEVANSIGYFERALALDPEYAPAYVGIADAYRATVLIADADPRQALAKAKSAADRAIAIDDSYAEAHAMKGWLMFWYDWDWAGAETEAKRALELDPESSDARQFYAHLLSNTGRHEEALNQARRALEIEPLSMRANSFYGMFLYQAGRNEEAIAQFQRVLELDPRFRLALMFLCRTYIDEGKYEDAIELARKAGADTSSPIEPPTYEAYALAATGRQAEARSILQSLLQKPGDRYVSPYNIALVYTSLGDRENALENLERAYAERDIRMVFLGVDTKLRTLATEPRFVELIRKMRLQNAGG